jgi:hypothetical protein
MFPKRTSEIELFGEAAKVIINSDRPSYDKHVLLNTLSQGLKVEIKPITLLENLSYLDNRTFGELVCFISNKGIMKTNNIQSSNVYEVLNQEKKMSYKREIDKKIDGEPHIDKKRKLNIDGDNQYTIINFGTEAPLNVVESFHDGRPCLRCNRAAEYFNNKGEKISMPKQHSYGKCPLYCNICVEKSYCLNINKHLAFSCTRCKSTYSNHPTNKCKF